MKLSIITINYNNSEGLTKTMESVLAQTFADYEYLVIDGGSTDSSKDIIEKNKHKLAYWISEKDAGVYNAMNKGILKARGEYLLFLNSGDWFISPTILQQVFSESLTEDVVYGDLDTPLGKWTYPAELTFAHFFRGGIGHPAAFIRRDLFDRFGLYSEEYKISSDWEFFMICLVKHGRSYKKIDRVISHFNLDGISSTQENKRLKEKEKELILEKHFPLMLADYRNYFAAQRELEFYRNSKVTQLIKRFQESAFYKKIRRIPG